ncbi:MAG: 23S rRNA (adenine(2503)-C(2))-methyltransferase RlmN [Bernardetiaceae bacterium]|nr:23S rRNA (adenine(2503)-C(2))-methyltransferase RlmN [Bernardetiaceae bacterium]
MSKTSIRINLPTLEDKKPDIRKMSLEELKMAFLDMGEKSFRAKQVYEWLWKKAAQDFDTMSNLSKSLRENLKNTFDLRPLQIDDLQKSKDGTVKSIFKLHDGHLIEGVLIPTETRMTACISSQVGCSLACKFCATGYMDKKRNVEAAEIYDQVIAIDKQAQAHFGKSLTNIVFMGMGEPLLNYREVLRSVDLLCSPEGLNMSPRRITVSTAGIAKMIRRLGDDKVRFNLALSLHAADDEKRDRIMDINDSNNLQALSEALTYFYQQTQNRITFEYILFHRFNDSLKDAENLYKFVRKHPARINIIEYNPISEANFMRPEEDKIDSFAAYLIDKGIRTTVRRSRGKDIDAACGQLANKKPQKEALLS